MGDRQLDFFIESFDELTNSAARTRYECNRFGVREGRFQIAGNARSNDCIADSTAADYPNALNSDGQALPTAKLAQEKYRGHADQKIQPPLDRTSSSRHVIPPLKGKPDPPRPGADEGKNQRLLSQKPLQHAMLSIVPVS
ncbi:MAG: hypothetical protein JOY71_31305 [Acetobacteraceae bacterium]|nr:hypothetical protein [Acetobacteraceae bacterium]